QGAVGELLGNGTALALPAGPLRGDPDPGDARGRDGAGARPALQVGVRVDLRARRERLARDLGLLDAVEPEVTRVVLLRVEAEHVPALAPVDQPVGLDRAL